MAMEDEENQFNLGDVVFWAKKNFNKSYWDSLTWKEIDQYYGWTKSERLLPDQDNSALGTKPFIFITEITQCPGHCVLIDQETGAVQMMRHTCELRLATEDEV